MDKGKWISAKIRELEHENKGRSHEQNIAIAFSMWNEKKEDGGEQLTEYQGGGWGLGNLNPPQIKKEEVDNTNNFGFPVTGTVDYGLPVTKVPTAEEWKQNATGVNPFGFKVNTNPNYGTPVTTSNNNPNWGKMVTTTGDEKPFVSPSTANVDVKQATNVKNTTPAASTQTKTNSRFAKPEIATDATQDMKDVEASNLSNLSETQTDEDIRFTEQYKKDENQIAIDDFMDKHKQFVNPYGGIDLETSLVGLGQGIERGDTKAIVGNSLLAGLKGARNVMGGMGLANRENQVMQDYWDKQREGMIGNSTYVAEDGGFFQEGGYAKTGNTNINDQDVARINKGQKVEFTPEFAKEYFSTQTESSNTFKAPVVPNTNVMDITSDGQFTDRKVWRTQRPEWFVGKQEAVEGKDYTRIPYKQWEAYQQSPEYATYTGKTPNRTLAEFQEGGEQFQNPQEMTPPQNGEQEQQASQQEQMMEQIAGALQGGATPEQVVQKLVESGMSEEQATQIVQAVIQQIQGQQQQQQAPQEQPQMKDGGEYLSLLKGKKIKDYKLDPKTNMYTVEYE